MKKEPLPSIEDLSNAQGLKRIDLSRLKNRLAGKSLVEFEHCLIEILGGLVDYHRIYKECVGDLSRACIEARTRDEFMSAYLDYSRDKAEYTRNHVNFSPCGRFFQALLDRLNNTEDKQAAQGKPLTVSHARTLAALVVAQLNTMAAAGMADNHKVRAAWDYWHNAAMGATNG